MYQICVRVSAFRFGEIVNINMVRDKKTGKTKGYAFVCYEDQRSTILAVDNFNLTKVWELRSCGWMMSGLPLVGHRNGLSVAE